LRVLKKGKRSVSFKSSIQKLKGSKKSKYILYFFQEV